MANFLQNTVGGINSTITRGGTKLGDLTGGLTSGIKSITDPVEELFGVKGELYTIGYIAAEFQEKSPLLSNGLTGGLIKAYQNAAGMANQFGADIGFGMPLQNATTVDGFFRFEGDMGVELPTYPIQFQTNINMHRIRTTDVVSTEIFISSRAKDDPLEAATQIITNNDFVSLLTGVSGDVARVRRKINELRWLQNNGQPFLYYTPHCVYENMLLKRIRPKNDEQTMDGFSAVLEFQEVIYYTDANDSTSRRNKKPLSEPGNAVVESIKQITGQFW